MVRNVEYRGEIQSLLTTFATGATRISIVASAFLISRSSGASARTWLLLRTRVHLRYRSSRTRRSAIFRRSKQREHLVRSDFVIQLITRGPTRVARRQSFVRIWHITSG